MLSRRAKVAFFYLLGPIMKLNGYLYRCFRAPRTGIVKVHLGSGQKNYLDGWINIDANRFTGKCDVWADLRNPLPFHDNTVDAIYSYHFIEHLPDTLLGFHFREMFRCLKPGGVFRVGGPNGDAAIQKFIEGDSAWFSDWPEKRKSIGGRFANFIFCRNEHMTILTFSYLKELAADAGFENIIQVKPVIETYFSEFFDEKVLITENERTLDSPHTLIVEGKIS